MFICGDTQVILRINSRDGVINNGIGEANEDSLVKGRSGKSKIYSKRMTKRLITAAPTTTAQLVITEVLLSKFFELVKGSSINNVTLRQ